MSEQTINCSHDQRLDTSGLACPLPVIKCKKALASMAKGAVLLLICTDPLAQIDVPHFCNTSGHELISQVAEGEKVLFLIRKGSK